MKQAFNITLALSICFLMIPLSVVGTLLAFVANKINQFVISGAGLVKRLNEGTRD